MDPVGKPLGNCHLLILQNSIKPVAWTISGKVYRQKEYQKGLQPLLQTPEEPVDLNIISRLGANGLAGVKENMSSLM